MTCEEFKKYLSDRDGSAARALNGELAAHTERCDHCRSLLVADEALEEAIRSGLKKVSITDRLLSRIEQDVRALEKSGKNGRRFLIEWKMAIPVMAMAALVLIIVLPMMGGIKNPEKLGRLAVNNHMKNMTMMFEADKVSDIPGWFAGRLDFPVDLPDLAGEGFRLLGGRKCSLGSKEVAYLFYDRNGERVSLFILNPAEIGFEVKKGLDYQLPVNNNSVRIWKDGSLVYVMVRT